MCSARKANRSKQNNSAAEHFCGAVSLYTQSLSQHTARCSSTGTGSTLAVVQIALIQTAQQHLGSGDVGGNGHTVHIAQAQQVLLVQAGSIHLERVAEEQHQIHFVAGNAGSDLLYAAQLAGEITMHRQTGGLRQHPSGSTGGNDYIFGKDRAVGSAELKREFLAGIVCKNGNRHSVLSFVLSIVLWGADSFEAE